jgi:hypothetical protein
MAAPLPSWNLLLIRISFGFRHSNFAFELPRGHIYAGEDEEESFHA